MGQTIPDRLTPKQSVVSKITIQSWDEWSCSRKPEECRYTQRYFKTDVKDSVNNTLR